MSDLFYTAWPSALLCAKLLGGLLGAAIALAATKSFVETELDSRQLLC